MQAFVDRGVMAGAVTLVASAEKVLGIDAVGYADLVAKDAMRPDSVFWIASTTKPMTATALMMLVDEGKVKLDDPVERFLPEFAGQMLTAEREEQRMVLIKPSRPITVRDVLSHTSGLPFMSRAEKVIDARPLREAVLSYALTPLDAEPGTRYAYSNAGTNTVGRIIEVLSGVPYEHFMQARLFGPLGMKDTTFFPTAQQVQRLAKSYKPATDRAGLEETPISQFLYPLVRGDRYPCPAGGLFSTAEDVAVFGRMILCGGQLGGRRYLSESAVREMTSTQTGTLLAKDGSGYGLAWSTTCADGTRAGAPAGACGHGGAHANDLWIDPQSGLVMVFMVQQTGGFVGVEGNPVLPAFRKAAIDAFGK